MESKGTKGFTKKEIIKILNKYPIENLKIKTLYTYYDRLQRFNWLFRKISLVLPCIIGMERVGWFLTMEFIKKYLLLILL